MSQLPFKSISNTSVADGEVDNDGLVGINSGLAIQLGSDQNEYFDHSKDWDINNKQVGGSWYRLFDGPWNHQNHASIRNHSDTGAWINENLINSAGPDVGKTDLSSWDSSHPTFDPNKPKIIVLLHGATDRSNMNPEQHVNELKNAGDYWGWDFIHSLIGGQGNAFYNLSNKAFTKNDWNIDFTSSTPSIDDHFIVPDLSGGMPQLSLMLTYRDGSEKLVTQAKKAIKQIHDLYTKKFQDPNNQPQIIFVVHSMGGNVSRYLLTAPTGSIDNLKLTQKEQEKATFIRDRTVFLTTISTPHEGSVMADKITEAGNIYDQLPSWYDDIRNAYPNMFIAHNALDSLGAFRDATNDLRVSSWDYWNKGILSPEKMKRSDGSLIPIYCLGGRTPGGDYFDNPNDLLGGINPIPEVSVAEGESFFLVLADWGLHNISVGPTGWGAPPTGSRDLDQVKKVTLNEISPVQIKLLNIFFKITKLPITSALFDAYTKNLPYYIKRSWEVYSIGEMAKILKNSYHYTAFQILEFIKEAYTSNIADAGRILKEINFSVLEVAKAIKEVFNASALEISDFMNDVWNKSLTDTANLLNDLDFSSSQIIKAIKDSYYASVIDITRLIKSILHKNLYDATDLLKKVGFSSYEIIAALLKIYTASSRATIKLLRDLWGMNAFDAAVRLVEAGYTSYDVIEAMKSVYNASAKEVATFLKDRLGKNIYDTAKRLFATGYSSVESIKALKSVFHATAIQMAKILRSNWQKNASNTVRILHDIGISSYDIAKVMREVFNSSITTIMGVLHNELNRDAITAAGYLKSLGFAADDIVKAMRYIYGSSANTIAKFMRDKFHTNSAITAKLLKIAGFSSNEVAKAMRSVFNSSAKTIASFMKNVWSKGARDTAVILRQLGFSTTDIAEIMKNIFHSSATEIAEVMKDYFHKSMEDTAKTLKSVGFSIEEIFHVILDVFNSSTLSVAMLIKDLWGLSESLLKSILKNLNLSYIEIIRIIRAIF